MNAPQQQLVETTFPLPDQIVLNASITPSPVQPDALGEFPTPLDGALFMAGFGIPQIPLRGKAPFLKNWTEAASTNPDVILAWSLEHPSCNFGSMAVPGSHFIFDADRPKDASVPVVRERFQALGGAFTSKLIIESSPGKGHRYYRSAPGIDGNVSESGVKFGDFSLRVNGEQCVSPGSIHPVTLCQYRIAVNGGLVPPTPSEVAFWLSEKVTKTGVAEPDDQSIVHEGARDNTMASILGKARQVLGMDREELFTYGSSVNEKRFSPPLSEADILRIANSIGRYEIKKPITVLLGAVPAGQPSVAPADDLSWLELSEVAPRPIFPWFVMKGTSLYEGLAKPVSEVNSKLPELIWLPATQLMLNSLHGRVSIKGMRSNVNMFLGIISSPGKFFKSSSCRLAHEYFQHIGMADYLSTAVHNCDGKIMIGQGGSSEGFGIQMQRVNAKHGVFFNDELGKLVSKAGIENSSLPHDLLSWYESNDFSNNVTNPKNLFTFTAGSYCFGWQFCTTIRGFNSQWSRLAGIASGMPDRTFFLITPEEPKTLTGEVEVNTVPGAFETKARIDQAMIHKEYEIVDYTQDRLREKAAAFGDPRSMNMVYKFALYFAVDLGLDEIDEDCIERALALVKYRQDAVKFLRPIEARNDEGRLLQEIVREIQQNGGKMNKRAFDKAMHPEEYGDRMWSTVYGNAIRFDRIREFTEKGKRGQTRKMIGLVKDDIRLGPADE